MRFRRDDGEFTLAQALMAPPERELETVAGGEPITVLVLTAIGAGVVVGGAIAAIYDKYN